MKIVTIVGARPQFVKAAVVSHTIQQAQGIVECLVHTGQHHDHNMSAQFFHELGIPEPTHHLGVHGGSHGSMTGQILERVEPVLMSEQPDVVLVYGDTNSTLAGALAASKLNMPIAHVEAGLRSFNRRMPEEVNRVLTDHLSSLLFAPTTAAVDNLRREGLMNDGVALVGDVMYDAALRAGAVAGAQSTIHHRVGVRAGHYLLATIHRAENTNDIARLSVIVEALREAAASVQIVWPVHPRTRAILNEKGWLSATPSGLRVIEPVGYIDMVALEMGAKAIVTDSGGVQKEAFFFRVPCLTLRNETEWVELVELGANRLVPPVAVATVVAAIREVRPFPETRAQPYGDGQAGMRIVDALRKI